MPVSPSLPLPWGCISDQQSTQQHIWKSISAQQAAAATSEMPEDAAEEGTGTQRGSSVTTARLGTKIKKTPSSSIHTAKPHWLRVQPPRRPEREQEANFFQKMLLKYNF